MLDSLRQAANSWVAKLLMIVLVLSFGIWGVAGRMISGYGEGSVARVGGVEISAAKFDRAYRTQVEAISNQTGGKFTADQARSLGMPQQVLGQLISEAAVDDQAQKMNLGVPEDRLARTITDDPSFRGVSGSFDRQRFTALLRNSGLREDDYVKDVRGNLVRQQISSAVAGNISAPQPLVEALYRYQNEERTISFLPIDEGSIDPVGDPDPTALQTYFDAHKDQFRAPEYRKLDVLTLNAAAVSDPAAVTDADVAADYQRRVAEEFTRPERRRVEQIRFDTKQDAEKAAASAASGTDFLEIAKGRGMTEADADLGMKAKPEIIDSVVADASFAAARNAVVAVPDGKLGPAVIRVTTVEPGTVTPLAEASAKIRVDLALRRAKQKVSEVYDAVEDQRAGGSTLPEIGQSMKLPYRVLDAVARDGTAADGNKIADLPGGEQLTAAAFDSDVGVENDAIRTPDDGYVFYDVAGITPTRDRTLDEAHDKVAAAWRTEEVANRVAAKADALLERLKGGSTLQAIAAELGKAPQSAENVKRGAPVEGLSRNAVEQAFAGPEGHVANAEADAPPTRILLHVDDVVSPAYFAESQDAKAIAAQLDKALQTDIFRSYNAQLIQARDTRINNDVFRQVTGEQAAN